MATAKRRFKSIPQYVNNISIRSKIFLSFLLIILLLAVQFSVSNTSINQLTGTFEDAKIQGQINERTRRVNSLYKTQQSIYLNYISGIDTNHLESYLFTKKQIDEEFLNIISDIKSLNPNLNRSGGIQIYNTLSTEKQIVDQEIVKIFSFIPKSIISNITSKLKNYENFVNEKTTLLFNWIYIGDENIDLGGELNDDLTIDSKPYFSLIDAIAPIEQINQTAFDEISVIMGNIKSEFAQYVDLNNLIQFHMGSVEFNISRANPDLINTNLQRIRNNSLAISEDLNKIFNKIDKIEFGLDTQINSVANKLNDFIKGFVILIRWSNDIKVSITIDFLEIGLREQVIITFMLFISIILTFVIVFLVQRLISRPIKIISFWSEMISDGDLTNTRNKMDREDEIGKLHNNFREMNNSLIHIIQNIQETSDIISVTADDLSSNTQEINATAEEVSAIAQSMAKGSTHQAELIATIVEELQITSEIVDNVIKQINYNLRIIHDLSEQTNILALNTAIEAANAGDFGKGFGVISERIRKMSTQTKKTTEEVTRGSREVLTQLQQTFSNITIKIENVAAVSEETAASAEEVAASAEEMTATMQNVSATSALLNDKSTQFQETVDRFKIEKNRQTKLNDDFPDKTEK